MNNNVVELKLQNVGCSAYPSARAIVSGYDMQRNLHVWLCTAILRVDDTLCRCEINLMYSPCYLCANMPRQPWFCFQS